MVIWVPGPGENDVTESAEKAVLSSETEARLWVPEECSVVKKQVVSLITCQRFDHSYVRLRQQYRGCVPRKPLSYLESI